MKIEELSYAINPGAHCDLFGAVMIAAGIEDLKILVVGTEECTYYSKNFIFEYGKKDKDESLLMLPLTDKEIVLGIGEKLLQSIDEIIKLYSPKILLIVTTCIIELTGEDIEGIIKSIEKKYNTKILLMRTEHFKCDNYIKGMGKTINLLGDLIEENKTSKSFNILGMRYKRGENSEICKLLQSKGISLNKIVPYSIENLQDIKSLSKAKLNIVVDITGMELAEYMYKKFEIPYINLIKIGDIEFLKNEYLKLEQVLNIDIKTEVEILINDIQNLKMKIGEKILKTKKAIVAPISVSAIEIAKLIETIKIISEIVVVKEIYNFEEESATQLKAKYGTRFVKSGNLEPIRELYNKLNINYFIGMEYPQVLSKCRIKHLNINYLSEGKFGLEAVKDIFFKISKECDKDEKI